MISFTFNGKKYLNFDADDPESRKYLASEVGGDDILDGILGGIKPELSENQFLGQYFTGLELKFLELEAKLNV